LRWRLSESRCRSEKDCGDSCYSVHVFSLDGDGDRDHLLPSLPFSASA
jgi:hypothetical protein